MHIGRTGIMASFLAAWMIALAFVGPPRQREQRQDMEHRVLHTTIYDEGDV